MRGLEKDCKGRGQTSDISVAVETVMTKVTILIVVTLVTVGTVITKVTVMVVVTLVTVGTVMTIMTLLTIDTYVTEEKK